MAEHQTEERAERREHAPRPEPFGGRPAPPFKPKSKAAKWASSHKLAVAGIVVGIAGILVTVMLRSSGGSSTTASSSQGTAAPSSSAADTTGVALGSTTPGPYMYDYWPPESAAAGSGGGGPAPPGGLANKPPPAKAPPAKASTGAASPQPKAPASRAAVAPARSSTGVAPSSPPAPKASAFLSATDSAPHSVTEVSGPMQGVAVGTSAGNGSAVQVPYTARVGTPAPVAHVTPHVAQAARSRAGRTASASRHG